MGIQKIEQHLRELFPGFRLLRMDQDTTSGKGSHLAIIDQFSRGEADILLGTQMVAKGLNFPEVDLVGVLQADIGLAIPDFRSSERLFQLLTQVAGRAGRKSGEGEVFIQSFSPSEPSIQFAKAQAYAPFFEDEIAGRELVLYPPFCRLVRLLLTAKDEAFLLTKSEAIAGWLRARSGEKTHILGPVPATMSKLKDDFRVTILIKGEDIKALHLLLDQLTAALANEKKKLYRVTVDVDPIYMG